MLSDQLSDYEGEDGYTTAHVDIRSSRSARDFGRASGMLHTEEVTGSNPVSPTIETLVGGGSCQAMAEGVLGPPVVCGPGWIC